MIRMEEREITTSLIYDHETASSSSPPPPLSSSSVTFMLVFTTLIIACASFIYGWAIGYSSAAQFGIMKQLGLSLASYSLFASTLTIGGVGGALFCGKAADQFGRRGAIWVSNFFYVIGCLTIAFSKRAWSLGLGNLVIGIAVGISSYVTPIYVAEITPTNSRGAFSAFNILVMSSGTSVIYIIGSICNWRMLALLGAIPCVIIFFGAFFIPESPRWLAKVGRDKDVEISLQMLRGKNVDISLEAAEIINYTRDSGRTSEAGIRELFQWKYARAIIIGVVLMLLVQFGGSGAYVFYLSSILESAGFSSGIGSTATSITQIVMNIYSVFLIDKYGRRPLLMVSSVGCSIASSITGLSFLLKDFNVGKEVTPVLALTGILVYMVSLSIGLAGIPLIIVAEIFPTRVKGKAGSLVNVINWSGSWIVTYTFNYMFDWCSAGIFFVYSIISCLGFIFIANMVPETKGRTLEQIHASLITQNESNQDFKLTH